MATTMTERLARMIERAKDEAEDAKQEVVREIGFLQHDTTRELARIPERGLTRFSNQVESRMEAVRRAEQRYEEAGKRQRVLEQMLEMAEAEAARVAEEKLNTDALIRGMTKQIVTLEAEAVAEFEAGVARGMVGQA
jgi:hypothetical protein